MALAIVVLTFVVLAVFAVARHSPAVDEDVEDYRHPTAGPWMARGDLDLFPLDNRVRSHSSGAANQAEPLPLYAPPLAPLPPAYSLQDTLHRTPRPVLNQ
ncbi:hypothetical protein OBBRIDRAFT_796300 [Obba rivulosa]|uniref:Secreted protein n=1 Tax=Obba rivulosa TaxID=1052685 RepID=A0A8E2AN84_9APHY|nr:hypothetical protein OBBRIDRAFT_796300 [Obba rivulosa]